jgi:hypothetical protein
VDFKDFTLLNTFTVNSRLAQEMFVKFAAWPRLCAMLCKTSKQAVNFSVHQDGGRPSTWIPEILDKKQVSLKYE